MRIEYTAEQQALSEQLRAYFKELMTPELEAEIAALHEGGGPLYHQALQQLGRDRWLGIGWAVEYGGQGRTAIEQYIFADEVQRAGFPLPFLTLETVGPTLAERGTAEQRRMFVPRILAGTLHFAIGYTEPGAGTDLASLTTRAVRDGDSWVINGQKVFTSGANYADYIWLAVRTDADARKHKGISIIMVPTAAPGFSLTPIHCMGGLRTNATYYDDVRVPLDHLVGEVNQGWGLITSQLNRERLSLVNHGAISGMLADVTTWARGKRLADGRRLMDLPRVQTNLARVKAGVAALRLLCWKQAWAIERGELSPADASAAKVYGSELFIEAYRLLLEVMGQAGYVKRGSPEAVLHGLIESRYASGAVLTFGGGTNEIQRDIIAAAGLRMPRGER